MRRHFELFLRCMGVGLLCAGVILSVRASLALMQPMPDVSGGWSELLRSKELAGKVPDFFQQARDGYLRAALMELVAFGLTPLALGVLLLKLARPIAAWNYPSAGEGPPAPGEEPISRPPAGGGLAPRREEPPRPEDPDLKYAPPGGR